MKDGELSEEKKTDDRTEGKSKRKNKQSQSLETKDPIEFEWTAREIFKDCVPEGIEFCQNVTSKLNAKYEECSTHKTKDLAKCFDINEFLKNHIQKRDDTNDFGLKEFETFLTYVTQLPHIVKLCQDTENSYLLLSDPSLEKAAKLLHTYQEAILQIVVDDVFFIRNRWFSCEVDGKRVANFEKTRGLPLKTIKIVEKPNKLDCYYELQFENYSAGFICRLNSNAAYATFYNTKDLYSFLGREFCIVLDVVLAMSGCESIVESYYSVQKLHSKPGGMENETLASRTNVDWAFPLVAKCPKVIEEVASLYINGDKDFNLIAHKQPIFVDQRSMNKYKHDGKVMNRHFEQDDSFVL